MAARAPRRRQLLVLGTACALPGLTPAAAGDATRLVYPRHAGRHDTMNGYAPELLRLALERSGRSYTLAESIHSMAQSRAVVEMLRTDTPIDVFWTVTTPQRQQSLLAVRIPIERGLIGWRVALVRRADAERWRGVRSLSQIASLSAGQKHDWPDVDILRSNGLKVQTGAQYESLFGMLALGRIDYFPRSVLEVQAEVEAHAAQDLVIEPYLGLRYPSAMYFFVPPQRAELAADITAGLERAQSDGSFEKLFHAHFKGTIETLHLKERRVFALRNPTLPPDAPLQRREWWMMPT